MHSEVSFCGLPKEIRLSILEYNEFDLWTFAPINKSIRQDVAFLKAQKPPTDIVDPTQRCVAQMEKVKLYRISSMSKCIQVEQELH